MTSRYNYIPTFSFEPAVKIKEYGNNYCKTSVSLGVWRMKHKDIIMNLPAFTWCYRNVKSQYPLYRKLINSITHEVLHGVIQKMMEQDKWSGSCYMEWPHKHGMDNDYKRAMKRLYNE